MQARVLLLAGLAAVTSVGFSKPPKPAGSGVWEHASSGSLPLTDAGRLRVITRGAVIVRGAAVDQVRYILRVRAEGVGPEDTKRLEKAVFLHTKISPGFTELTVVHVPRTQMISRLEIIAPNRISSATLKAQNGDVEAYDIGGNVEGVSTGGRVQLDRIGGEVTARTGGGEIRMGGVNGSVRALSAGGSIMVDRAGGESWFETSGGEIYLGEALGPVHASTAGGSIRVGNAGSSVSAHTAGGRIEIHRATGAVVAENSGGSIQVGEANGVRCESAAGTIRLKGATGSLRAVTDIGSILAELISGAKLQDSILSTRAGDITVFIPSNLALTVRAEREAGHAGRIVSDFPEIAAKTVNMSGAPALLAEGSLNGGGPVLQITVGGGTIYLRRVK